MALRRGPRYRAGNTDGSSDDAGGSVGASPDLVRDFVDEVTWFMSEHKISRADLAHTMGVSPGRVSQILSGDENLTLRTLSSVAAALGAEIEVALRAIDGTDGEAG
jgi:DNA-binding XRE family transcriptional regulator